MILVRERFRRDLKVVRSRDDIKTLSMLRPDVTFRRL